MVEYHRMVVLLDWVEESLIALWVDLLLLAHLRPVEIQVEEEVVVEP
jgi:hypothetical protein